MSLRLYNSTGGRYIYFNLTNEQIVEQFTANKNKADMLRICKQQEKLYLKLLKAQNNFKSAINKEVSNKEVNDFYESIANFFDFRGNKLSLNGNSLDLLKITSASRIELDESIEKSLAQIAQGLKWDQSQEKFIVSSEMEKYVEKWVSNNNALDDLLNQIIRIIANIVGVNNELIEGLILGYQEGGLSKQDINIAGIRKKLSIFGGKQTARESDITKTELDNIVGDFGITNIDPEILIRLEKVIKENSIAIQRAIVTIGQIRKNAEQLTEGKIQKSKHKNDLIAFLNILAGWVNQGGGTFFEVTVAKTIAEILNMKKDEALELIEKYLKDEINGIESKILDIAFGVYKTGTGSAKPVSETKSNKPIVQSEEYKTNTVDVAIVAQFKGENLDGSVSVSPHLDKQINLSVKKIKINKNKKHFSLNLKTTTLRNAFAIINKDANSKYAYSALNLLAQRHSRKYAKDYAKKKGEKVISANRVLNAELNFRKELAARMLVSALTGDSSGGQSMCQLMVINEKVVPIARILENIVSGESRVSATVKVPATVNKWIRDDNDAFGPSDAKAMERSKNSVDTLLQAEVTIKAAILQSAFASW